MLRWLLVAILPVVASCRGTVPVKEENFAGEYGLSGTPQTAKVDSDEYYSDMTRAEETVVNRSSLPLPIKVGKGSDSFKGIPLQASPPPPNEVLLVENGCQMRLYTDVVEVARFIWAGKWIKLNDSLPPNTPVKLDPGMDLFLRISTTVRLDIQPAYYNACAQRYRGKHFLMGTYNLDGTWLGLVTAPRSPVVQFNGRAKGNNGKKVFLRWGAQEAKPHVFDEMDFPLILETPIYRARFNKPGFYYLSIRPLLRKTKSIVRRPTPIRKNRRGH